MNDYTNGTRGWVPQPDGRGTIDIITSCVFTIILCCWSSLCVNVETEGLSDLRRLFHKFNLASIAILGPEFVFVLAVGQWSSARRSVAEFRSAGSRKYSDWTMKHAFFADMGGFLLQTTDEAPFPIDAKQLYYLLANDYLEYPSIDLVEIDDKNKTDGFARVLTIGQVLWFVVNCIGRGIQRLSTTTLELTTVGFVFCMLFTSLCWRHKPTGIKRPITLRCKTTVERILLVAGDGAKERYRYTPLDFVSRKEWSFSLFWAYDQNILRCLHLPIFGRSSTTLPRNRIPNANWPELDTLRSAYAWILSLVYGTIFVVCWNFAFPSDVERLLWRISSVGTMAIVVFGPIFEYCFIRNARFPEGLPHTPLPMENDPEYGSGHRGWIGIQAFKSTVRKVAASLRNNSLNQDPALTVPLRALIPLTILCAIYTIFRAYILIEDVLSLRLLPASTFETVSWAGYLPHI